MDETNEAQHTQGPWRAVKLADHWWEITARGIQLAELRAALPLDDDGKAAIEADAKLMAQSPEMRATIDGLAATLWPKRCPICGTLYGKEAWSKLPLINKGGGRASYGGTAYEFRDCPCGNTLTVIGAVTK